MSDIHICWTNYSEERVEEQDCPTCKGQEQFLCQFQDWYGWTTTCLNCGDSWEDGELCPRTFARGWRKEAVKHARDRAIKLGLLAIAAAGR